MPDCRTLTIDASWVSGWVNWREYWMNAWMSPIVIAPDDTRSPPMTAMATKFRLPRNIIAGWIDPGDELGAEAGLVELLVLVVEALLDVALAAEHLDERVAGERLLDLGVERAGVAPLGDEPRLRPLGDDLAS